MSLLRRVSLYPSYLFSVSVSLSDLLVVFYPGLHDLLAPDLTIADEWWVSYTCFEQTYTVVSENTRLQSFLISASFVGRTVRRTSTRPIGSWPSCRLWCDTSLAKNRTWNVRVNQHQATTLHLNSDIKNKQSDTLLLDLCFLVLYRRRRLAATDSVRCRGHGSYGSLLDRSHAKCVWVSINTRASTRKSF